MADNDFSLHVDNDWKKQAQEEKRRLAEEQAKKAAAPAPSPTPAPSSQPGSAPAAKGPRGRELPPASFSTLIQSLLTNVLYQLGAMSQEEGPVNLDAAKHQIDTLGVLEDKTRGNLTEPEQKLLDTALYETRTRYINVASQYINF
jgi:hypothetical protein